MNVSPSSSSSPFATFTGTASPELYVPCPDSVNVATGTVDWNRLGTHFEDGFTGRSGSGPSTDDA
jgi:hypothetical protein